MEVKTKLSLRSERVKCVDYHTTEPLICCGLYDGKVTIWNYLTSAKVRTIDTGESPVRCVRFIVKKGWLAVGSDDMQIRIYNANTSEKVTGFEAHSDYIRALVVHPVRSVVLSCSDDSNAKMWDWEKGWKCITTFDGHSHYIMDMKLNPRDTNTFATASLDTTIKMWTVGQPQPNYTLKGHEKGVNAIDFYPGLDKPFLVSGGDDFLVKVWDCQSKTCLATLEGHTGDINTLLWHPDLPLIISAGSDGVVRFWHSNTFRSESATNFGFDRAWCLASSKGINQVAIGFDDGTLCLQLGKEEPAISMDANGKVIWAKHCDIVTCTIKEPADTIINDESTKCCYQLKDLGTCELFPQSLQHSPNGRFVVVCGDGEYIIYTALAWRNKSFGKAFDFVWSNAGNDYAVRSASSTIVIYRNFEEAFSFRVPSSSDALFGGVLIGVRCGPIFCFYDWNRGMLVRRIDVTVTGCVVWNDSGDLVLISGAEGSYILRYQESEVTAFLAEYSPEDVPVQGIESAFEIVAEISEGRILNAKWVGDCLLFVTVTRLCYWIGGQVYTVTHFDSPQYFVGYRQDRVILVDRSVEFFSYSLPTSVIAYQSAIVAEDEIEAARLFPFIPNAYHSKIALFLESLGDFERAFDVAPEWEHKFDLAIRMSRLELALKLLSEHTGGDATLSEGLWKRCGDLALAQYSFTEADRCYWKAIDFPSLLLLHSCSGNTDALNRLGKASFDADQFQIAFSAWFQAGNLQDCVRAIVALDGVVEAAFFCRTYGLNSDEFFDRWNAKLQCLGHRYAGAIDRITAQVGSICVK